MKRFVAIALLCIASQAQVGNFWPANQASNIGKCLTSDGSSIIWGNVLPADTTATGSNFFTAYTATTGVFTKAQPAFTDVSGTASTGQIPNLAASKITSGTLALAQGGTNADLSASGSATNILAEDASHVVSARNLIAADIPSLAASKITSGTLALAQGGTNADLSGTGGTSQFLKQVSVGATITVVRPACADLSNAATSCSTDATNASNISAGTLGAARLPNPSASTLGGIQSLASVSSKWINTISTSGVPSATQPAFSDISGSVAASQLPNPSATTLGGIESLASVASKWINTISTSGVPSATQPAFTDISGSVAASQLPNPSSSTLGGIQSLASVASKWINTISTSGVPSATQPAFTDISGASTNAQITNGISNFNQAAQSQVVVSGTEYYMTNSNLTMPATFVAGIAAGSAFRWRIAMTKTAAGTGTFQILLKHGANGSTADTTDATITIGTQTAAADNLVLDILITFTSTTAYYYTVIPHQYATTATGFGLAYPAVAAFFTGTVSGLTTTTGSTKWGLSFKATTGTPTITVPMMQAQAFNIT